MAEREAPTPTEQVARLYEQAESDAAKASERLVGSGGFAALLGMLAENAAALTKVGNDAMDLALRNLRMAGRRDIVRLSRQLARTEDKLERVLQELEEVHDELGRRDRSPSSSTRRAGRPGANGAPADEQAASGEKAGR
jgi:hypothetical protein